MSKDQIVFIVFGLAVAGIIGGGVWWQNHPRQARAIVAIESPDGRREVIDLSDRPVKPPRPPDDDAATAPVRTAALASPRANDDASGVVAGLATGILAMIGIGILFYFIPTFVAVSRGHHNRLAIFVLNLFLGCTILGWIGALVWSCTAVQRAPPRT